MHIQSCTLAALSLACQISIIVAQRGNNPTEITPTVCNNSPDNGLAVGVQANGVKRRALRRDETEPKGTFEGIPPLGRTVAKRSGTVNYNPNCNAPPPAGSKYGSDFPTMQSILARAYQDAVDLANEASVIQNDSPAYTHYFGPAQEQEQHFFSMMTLIADEIMSYTITFECSGTAGNCGTKQNIVASTDATAGAATDNKVINICPVFWTSAQTRYFLIDTSKGYNPGTPFRDNTTSGWCNNKLKSNFYATAGHTLLHELTHLDALAAAVGLTPSAANDPDCPNCHGTGDYQSGCQLAGARDYLAKWNADNELASPDYNAESYAAAATELYFMNQCSFDEIPK